MNDNTENLFSITQAAKACNISRSTLIRLENRGLITPAYTSPKSGRRYYDNLNISRILEIQKFQSMGFNTEETISYFSGNGNAKELLSILEKNSLYFRIAFQKCVFALMMNLPWKSK